MRVRNWWCWAAMGVAATGGMISAQPLPGGANPLPTIPSGPLPAPGGAGLTLPPVSAESMYPPSAAPTPPAPQFIPAQPPAPLPPPTVTRIPGPVHPAMPVSPPPTPVATTPGLVAPPAPAEYGQPALSVKQSLPASVAPGQPLTAEVTVTNVGTKAAENVILTGWWTAGYDISEQSVASQSINGRRSWGMGSIAPSEARVLRLKLVPAGNTPPTQEFRSGFDATFSSAVTDTRSIKVLKPELKVAVTAPEQVFVGQPVGVQIKVTNASAIPVQKMVVQSFMSGGVSYPKLPSGAGSGLTSEPISLMPGGTDVIPLDLSAIRAGEGKVTVRVTAEGADPVTHEVTIKVVEARMGVTLHGPKALYQNWPATYEAVIENQGDHPIHAATFEVKLPSGLTDNLRASDKPGYDAASNRLVWTFDVLRPGEKKTVLWFGYSKQADDLLTTGTATVGGMPLKRAEWVTKNLGTESK
jgi:uncharacterized repeat protein (TIGR01451 family)